NRPAVTATSPVVCPSKVPAASRVMGARRGTLFELMCSSLLEGVVDGASVAPEATRGARGGPSSVPAPHSRRANRNICLERPDTRVVDDRHRIHRSGLRLHALSTQTRLSGSPER